ncbi:MAG: ParB/RepB/Spo0J family partition protein [Oscillospiraceae bacterium]|jgi:ParB family chromosome partitioning protein|nr:ParB/RepB/Spo0J family partition protein [Oscillospiraceae bacterium]
MPLTRRKNAADTMKIYKLPVSSIFPNSQSQRRERGAIELLRLARSIRKYGVLQPLGVRKLGGMGYELVFGERRLRAAAYAGLERVPCVIIDAPDTVCAAIALSENAHRLPLGVEETARTLRAIGRSGGLSLDELAEAAGLAPSDVTEKLRVLRLPRELLAIAEGAGLSERHLAAVLRLGTDGETASALLRAVSDGLTAAETEELVARALRGEPEEPRPATAEPEETVSGRGEQPTDGGAPRRVVLIRDYRFYVNTIERGAEIMRSSGTDVSIERGETDGEVTLTVRIAK